jgi:hypothetical protein
VLSKVAVDNKSLRLSIFDFKSIINDCKVDSNDLPISAGTISSILVS